MIATVIAIALLAPAGGPPVSGDFDRDGQPDTAEIRQHQDGDYGLFVLRGATAGRAELIQTVKARDLANFFVETVDVADLQVWCAGQAGHRACALLPPEDSELLSFGSSEASQAIAVWRSGKAEVVWLTD